MLANPFLQIVLLFGLVVATGLLLTGFNDFVSRLNRAQREKGQQRTLVVAALPPAVKRVDDSAEFKVLTVKTRASTGDEAELPKAA